jgi:hypothetical protein
MNQPSRDRDGTENPHSAVRAFADVQRKYGWKVVPPRAGALAVMRAKCAERGIKIGDFPMPKEAIRAEWQAAKERPDRGKLQPIRLLTDTQTYTHVNCPSENDAEIPF